MHSSLALHFQTRDLISNIPNFDLEMEPIYLTKANNPKMHPHPRKLFHLITNALHIIKSRNGELPRPASTMSFASTSSSSHHQNQKDKPSEPVAERIVRALRHRLLLLHRADSIFFILGATGNVYTVTLSSTPTCTCPDHTTPCKHILFVYLRVLGLSQDDVRIQRKTLRPCQLSALLKMPTLPDAVAGTTLRERFHQQYFQRKQGSFAKVVKIEEDGTTCPVCLEEMKKAKMAVACGTCRNAIHEECLVRWKRSRGSEPVCCVLCRTPWRDRTEQRDTYLNLSAYVSEDDFADANDGSNGRST